MADTAERSQGMVGEGDWIDDKYSSFHNPEMETGSIDAHPNMLKYPSLDDYRSKHITDPLTEEEVEFRLTEHDAKLTTPRLLQTVIQAIISAFDHSGQVYVTGESTECVITLAVPNSAVDKLKQVLAENSLFVEEVGVRTIKFGKNGQKLEIRSTTRRDIKSHSLDFRRANPVCRSLQAQLTVNLMQTLKILMKQKHRSSGMEQEDRGRLERLVRQLDESQEKLAVEQSERSRLAERLKNSEEEVKTLKENYGKLEEKARKRWDQIKSVNEINKELDDKSEEMERELTELKQRLQVERQDKERVKAELAKLKTVLAGKRMENVDVVDRFQSLQIVDQQPGETSDQVQNTGASPMMNARDGVARLQSSDLEADGEPYKDDKVVQMKQVSQGVQPSEEEKAGKKGAKLPFENTQPGGSMEEIMARARIREGASQPCEQVKHSEIKPGTARYSQSVQPQGDNAESTPKAGGNPNSGQEADAYEESGAVGEKPGDVHLDMTASSSDLPAAISCTGGSQTQTELMITQARLKQLEKENRLLAESNSKESYQPAASNSNLSKKSSEKKREDILKDCTEFVGERLSVKDWKRLARKLGVSDSDIEIIEYENHGNVREMIHTMLIKWKREHKDATTATLIKGLESIRLNRLAHEVRTKFPTDTSSDEPLGRESQEGRMSGNFEAAGDSTSNIPHDEPEALFTNEFLEDLERLTFNQDDIIVVVKKLKLTGDKQMELHKTSNPLNVACVSKVWESMTRPMQQDEETQCRLIRSFVRVMRDIKRNDIVKVLKEHIPRGVGKIGTQLAEKQPLQNIPFSIRTQLVNLLSIQRTDGKDWRQLAEDINIPNANTFIKLWEQRPTPGELVLHTWQSRADATVGNLYKLLVKNGMNDSAALLE